MPWCPNCKNEYKDGYTICADCGAELVDELIDETKNNLDGDFPEGTEINDSINDYDLVSEEEISVSEDILRELVDNIEDTDEEALANFIKAAGERKIKKVEPFVKASQRAENYRSSAYALLLVGILGLAFLVCAYFKVISISLAPNINSLFYVVMGVMFIAFIIIGVKTFISAKAIDQGAKDEDELTERIYEFFKGKTPEDIDKDAFKEDSAILTKEEKFFPRSVVIKDIIVQNFGELDESFMTELVETVYSNIFE